MNRRGLLLGLGGILTAGIAPAFVKNPMKIVVPSTAIILPAEFRTPNLDYVHEHILRAVREMAHNLYKESGYRAAADATCNVVLYSSAS